MLSRSYDWSANTIGISVTVWFRHTGTKFYARIFDFSNGAGVNNVLMAREATNLDAFLQIVGTPGFGLVVPGGFPQGIFFPTASYSASSPHTWGKLDRNNSSKMP
jgi:hypothetical protein